MHFIQTHIKFLTILSVTAGVLYNSWPLGHWLNPVVSKVSLASGLEAVGQPYNWLFIGGDVISSLIIIVFCSLMWRNLRDTESHRLLDVSLVCTVLFAIGTIIDALLPLRCVQGLQVCPNFATDHLLLVHGIFSILASVFLFIGLLILWFYHWRNVLINIFIVGYVAFGVISLVEAVLPGENGNWSQDYYITLCSVWIAIIPFVIYQVLAD